MPKTGKFVSPSLVEKYPNHQRIGRPITGKRFDAIELVCEVSELREVLTSGWFVALGTKRASDERPLKLTIHTEIP